MRTNGCSVSTGASTVCLPPSTGSARRAALLNGERYLTDKEVGARLKVSRRTLQDYRNAGRIPYILLGGKLLYRESDIERLLMEGYRPAVVRT